ncbi:MAG: ATPase, T2SS/T4P/T4SS family [Planctomycetota bacterium]|jgi:type IV pilus assembly protein PilB
MMTERFYTTYQVADLLGAKPEAVADWMQKGWLAFERLPDGPVRVSEKGLISFLKQQGIDFEAIVAKEILRHEQQAAQTDRESAPQAERSEKALLLESTESPPEASEPGQAPPALAEPDVTRIEPEPVVAPEPAVALQPAVAPEPVDEPEPAVAPEPVPVPVSVAPKPSDAVEQVAQAICQDAVEHRATHVHLERREEQLTLHQRIDGVMHEKTNFAARVPTDVAVKLIDQFKSIAAMEDPTSEGSFTQSVAGYEITFNVSSVRTACGEKMVLHIGGGIVTADDLAKLNLSQEQEELLDSLIARPCGLVVLTGSPRSGRNDLLWALGGRLDRKQRSVASVERTLDIEIDSVTRTRSDAEASAKTIAALTRADSDVILIEEFSDVHALLAALDAVSQGRLLLGALRARNPLDGLGQILEADAAPWTLAASLSAIATPLKIRKLCEDCKKQADPSDELLAKVHLNRKELTSSVYTSAGCDKCGRTGYTGTVCVLSVLEVNETIGALLRKAAPMAAIERAAVGNGMKSIRQAALEKLNAGETSIEELARVLQ